MDLIASKEKKIIFENVIHSVLKITARGTPKHQDHEAPQRPLLRTCQFTSLIESNTFPQCQPPTLSLWAEYQASLLPVQVIHQVTETLQSENIAKFCWQRTVKTRLCFIHWQLCGVCGWSHFSGSRYKADLLLNAHLELLSWGGGCWF